VSMFRSHHHYHRVRLLSNKHPTKLSLTNARKW